MQVYNLFGSVWIEATGPPIVLSQWLGHIFARRFAFENREYKRSTDSALTDRYHTVHIPYTIHIFLPVLFLLAIRERERECEKSGAQHTKWNSKKREKEKKRKILLWNLGDWFIRKPNHHFLSAPALRTSAVRIGTNRLFYNIYLDKMFVITSSSDGNTHIGQYLHGFAIFNNKNTVVSRWK